MNRAGGDGPEAAGEDSTRKARGPPNEALALESATSSAASGEPPRPESPTQLQVPDHQLLRVIGRGAYGDVWLAKSVLGTFRAVKVVQARDFPDRHPFDREFHGIQRFEPVSRSHPGLIDILQVGRSEADGYFYYVMELADRIDAPPTGAGGTAEEYSPRTLRHDLRSRGRLPLEECVRIGIAMAGALEHLHAAGLVHRDVKPSNIIFVHGLPKLADIGLVTGVDDARSIVGTEGYLPPEGAGTPEADVYSLGKVLYEIATGMDRREFPALPAQGIDDAESERLVELNEVVLKACARDPALRHPTARALREELERLQAGGSIRRRRRWEGMRRRGRQAAPWLALAGLVALAVYGWVRRPLASPAGPPVEKASVFVLPFRGPNAEETFENVLADRMTDALIDGLAVVEGVRRSPKRSGWVAAEESQLLVSLARTNGMRHVLTGWVEAREGNLTLRVRLWDRARTVLVWSESFTTRTNDGVGLKRQVLDRLLSVLDLHPTEAESRRLDRVLAANEEAGRLFGEAVRLWFDAAGRVGVDREVMALTDRALQLDPGFLRAEYFSAALLGYLDKDRPPVEVYPAMRRRMDAILERDPTQFAALDHRAGAALVFEWNWERFDHYLQRAYRLGTSRSRLMQLGRAVWLRTHGRLDEARRQQEGVYRPDDADLAMHMHCAGGYWVDRRYDEALAIATNSLVRFPQAYWPRLLLAVCLVDKGDYDAALGILEAELAVNRRPYLLSLKGYALARLGRPEEARQVLDELQDLHRANVYIQPYYMARVHVALGDRETALDWLETAAAEHAEQLVLADFSGLRTDPAWDELQDHPRFQALLEKVGLDQWPVPIHPLVE